jgi:nitrogen fixation-related uncharacterized protein
VVELIQEIYRWIISGVGIAAVVAALFYWYAVYIDSKQYDDFDKKYRESRKEDGYKSGKSGRLSYFKPRNKNAS